MLAFELPPADAPADSPEEPVHAARKAATPAKAVPWRNRRRVRSGFRRSRVAMDPPRAGASGAGGRDGRRSAAGLGGGCCGEGASRAPLVLGGLGDDEAVIGRPRQLHLIAARPQLGPRRPLDILLVDGQRAAKRLDEVLGAHAEV